MVGMPSVGRTKMEAQLSSKWCRSACGGVPHAGSEVGSKGVWSDRHSVCWALLYLDDRCDEHGGAVDHVLYEHGCALRWHRTHTGLAWSHYHMSVLLGTERRGLCLPSPSSPYMTSNLPWSSCAACAACDPLGGLAHRARTLGSCPSCWRYS